MKTNRTNRIPILKISCAVFIFLAAGCENPYRKNYLSTVEKWPGAVATRLLKPPEPPKLVTSTDMKEDSQALLESGYVLLGRSTFRDTKLDETMALQQGQAVGAWVVMTAHKYVSTSTESVPFGQWTPDQTTVTTQTTQVQRDPSKPPVDIQQQTVQTVQGQYQTTYVPVNVDYYDYSASFWAKTKPSLIGVLVQPLTDDLKKSYQTNKGVLVKVVIRDSPAYNADVLKGDALMNLAGEEIRTPDQFFDIVTRHAGQKAALDLVRDGRDMTVQLTLNRD
ncbi:MAG TPA: PDZ domain-containing protein [bacterium]